MMRRKRFKLKREVLDQILGEVYIYKLYIYIRQEKVGN